MVNYNSRGSGSVIQLAVFKGQFLQREEEQKKKVGNVAEEDWWSMEHEQEHGGRWFLRLCFEAYVEINIVA